jgi:outer membrane protein assembly factor BamB
VLQDPVHGAAGQPNLGCPQDDHQATILPIFRGHKPVPKGPILRIATALLAIASTLVLPASAAGAECASLLAKITAVGREGAGNREAAQAVQDLVKLGPDVILDVLAAFDGADPVAANWLRAVVETLADRASAAHGSLPAHSLEAFVKDTRHDGAARQLAYELLERIDPETPRRLLPGLLTDPGQELRRAAVAAAIAEAQRLPDQAAIASALQKALAAARDLDQVEQLARKLAELGKPADLAAQLGFVRNWSLVGPFDNRGGQGFALAYPPEQGVDLRAAYSGKQGVRIGWYAIATADSPAKMDVGKLAKVDVNTLVGKHMGAVAYAFTAIESPHDQAVEVRVGTPNALKVFLNGQQILAREEYHYNGRLDTHTGRGLLRAGRNELLVKLCQNEQTDAWAQEWALRLRICDALGGAVPLTVVATGPETTRVSNSASTKTRAHLRGWLAWGLALGAAAIAGFWGRFSRFRPVEGAGRVAQRSGLVLFLLGSGALSAGEWSQFRGAQGCGVSNEAGLPIEWALRRDEHAGKIAESKNVRWVADLPGRGQSSPVTAGGRVYVTACTGYRHSRLHVLCFDIGSGRKLWERQFAATGNTACQDATSMAAPTPVTDGQRVWALFGSGDLVCLDCDGTLEWLRGLVLDYPGVSNTTGMAASLVLWNDVLIVPLENAGESFAAGLDTKTGQNRWKTERNRANNWTTPLVFTSGPHAEVLFQSATEITAYAPATGARLWSYQGHGLATIPSPTSGDGLLLVPGDELIALKPGSAMTAPEVMWSNPRLAPRNATPLVYQERVYTINSAGVLNCADVASGKLRWQQRLKGGFWASPVAAGGKLYCVNQEGTVFVIDPALDEGRLLRTNALNDRIVSTPAIADGVLLLRSDQHLYCLGETK